MAWGLKKIKKIILILCSINVHKLKCKFTNTVKLWLIYFARHRHKTFILAPIGVKSPKCVGHLRRADL